MGRSRLNPPTPSAKRSGRASTKSKARPDVADTWVMRMAFSTFWASSSSMSSSISGLVKVKPLPK